MLVFCFFVKKSRKKFVGKEKSRIFATSKSERVVLMKVWTMV